MRQDLDDASRMTAPGARQTRPSAGVVSVGLMMATSVSAPARFSILRGHHPVGASTGYMYDLRGDWPAQVNRAWELSPFAIELSALAEEELDGLAGYLASRPGLPCRYLSVHGPSRGRALPEPALVARLKDLSALVDGIVMHPDRIEDPALYRPGTEAGARRTWTRVRRTGAASTSSLGGSLSSRKRASAST